MNKNMFEAIGRVVTVFVVLIPPIVLCGQIINLVTMTGNQYPYVIEFAAIIMGLIGSMTSFVVLVFLLFSLFTSKKVDKTENKGE